MSTSGPFFAPGADAAVEQRVRRLQHDVAVRAEQLVQANLAGSLRHPTGRYQRAINIHPVGDAEEVTDGDVVYGPWLEGVSERNQATRFKGYASFRRATGRVIADAELMADRAVSDIVGWLS